LKSKFNIVLLQQKLILILLSCIIFTWTSCIHVRPVTATHYEIKQKNDRINNYYESFKFYIHEGDDFFRLKVKQLNDSSIVFNHFNKVQYKEFDENWSDMQKGSYYRDHKYDVLIYLKESLKINEHYEMNENSLYQLFQSEIDKIVIYEKFTNQSATVITTTTVVLLGGLLLIGLLFILLAILGIANEIFNIVTG